MGIITRPSLCVQRAATTNRITGGGLGSESVGTMPYSSCSFVDWPTIDNGDTSRGVRYNYWPITVGLLLLPWTSRDQVRLRSCATARVSLPVQRSIYRSMGPTVYGNRHPRDEILVTPKEVIYSLSLGRIFVAVHRIYNLLGYATACTDELVVGTTWESPPTLHNLT